MSTETPCGSPSGPLRARTGLAVLMAARTTPVGARSRMAASRMLGGMSILLKGKSGRSPRLELRCNLLRRAGQNADIDRNGREGGAQSDASLSEGGLRRQNTGRLPASPNATDRILDSCDDIRMSRLADMTEACGQIGWPDEDPVHSLNRSNFLQAGKSLNRLDLHQKAKLLGRSLGVAGG